MQIPSNPDWRFDNRPPDYDYYSWTGGSTGGPEPEVPNCGEMQDQNVNRPHQGYGHSQPLQQHGNHYNEEMRYVQNNRFMEAPGEMHPNQYDYNKCVPPPHFNQYPNHMPNFPNHGFQNPQHCPGGQQRGPPFIQPRFSPPPPNNSFRLPRPRFEIRQNEYYDYDTIKSKYVSPCLPTASPGCPSPRQQIPSPADLDKSGKGTETPTQTPNSKNETGIKGLKPGKITSEILEPISPEVEVVKVLSALDKAKAIKVEEKLTPRIFKGEVTHINDECGFLGPNVFFKLSVVVGDFPIVGDQVLVEAEFVEGMPFKWRCVTVAVANGSSARHSSSRNSKSKEKLKPTTPVTPAKRLSSEHLVETVPRDQPSIKIRKSKKSKSQESAKGSRHRDSKRHKREKQKIPATLSQEEIAECTTTYISESDSRTSAEESVVEKSDSKSKQSIPNFASPLTTATAQPSNSETEDKTFSHCPTLVVPIETAAAPPPILNSEEVLTQIKTEATQILERISKKCQLLNSPQIKTEPVQMNGQGDSSLSQNVLPTPEPPSFAPETSQSTLKDVPAPVPTSASDSQDSPEKEIRSEPEPDPSQYVLAGGLSAEVVENLSKSPTPSKTPDTSDNSTALDFEEHLRSSDSKQPGNQQPRQICLEKANTTAELCRANEEHEGEQNRLSESALEQKSKLVSQKNRVRKSRWRSRSKSRSRSNERSRNASSIKTRFDPCHHNRSKFPRPHISDVGGSYKGEVTTRNQLEQRSNGFWMGTLGSRRVGAESSEKDKDKLHRRAKKKHTACAICGNWHNSPCWFRATQRCLNCKKLGHSEKVCRFWPRASRQDQRKTDL